MARRKNVLSLIPDASDVRRSLEETEARAAKLRVLLRVAEEIESVDLSRPEVPCPDRIDRDETPVAEVITLGSTDR